MRNSPGNAVKRRALYVAAVTLTALGATSAQALAASELSPGTVYFTAGALTQTVTLTAGENLSAISAFRLRNPSNTADAAPGFTIGANTCGIDQANPPTAAAPKPISAGTCTISVTASGGAPLGASLQIATATSTPTVKGALLKANAPASRVCTNPAAPNDCGTSGSLAFSATVGTPTTQTFQIKNGSITNAYADLHVSRVDVTGPYSADASACATVPIAATCPVVVTFNPTAAGAAPGTLNVVSDDPIVPGPTVTLTGNATARPTGPITTGPGSTGPGTTTNPGTAILRKASVTGFSVFPRSVKPGRKASIRYTLSLAARVSIRFDRKVVSRGKTRYVRKASVSRNGVKGKNTYAFNGKIGGRPLPKGRYRARITAKNAAGTSLAKTTTFTVR